MARKKQERVTLIEDTSELVYAYMVQFDDVKMKVNLTQVVDSLILLGLEEAHRRKSEKRSA